MRLELFTQVFSIIIIFQVQQRWFDNFAIPRNQLDIYLLGSFLPEIAKSWSWAIWIWSCRITLIFVMLLANSFSEKPVKFQSNMIIQISNLVDSRSDRLWYTFVMNAKQMCQKIVVTKWYKKGETRAYFNTSERLKTWTGNRLYLFKFSFW